MKNLSNIPQLPTRTGNGRVNYHIGYVDKKTGKDAWSGRHDYGCWGFFYGNGDRLFSETGIKQKDMTKVKYVLTQAQIDSVPEVNHELTEKYLVLLKKAGVAQWFERVPKTIAEFSEGCVISAEYPAAMVIGLLEMYRNAYYHPMYMAYAVKLHEEYGISPGSSLLMPKIIRTGTAMPHADALYFAYSYTNSKKNAGARRYFADVFSERHILKCIENWNFGPMSKHGDFTGVFDFFACGYAKETRTPLSKDYPVALLETCALNAKEYTTRQNIMMRNPRSPELLMTPTQIEKLAMVLDKKFDEVHDGKVSGTFFSKALAR